MPNIDVWMLAILLALWIFTLVAIYFITQNNFRNKLQKVENDFNLSRSQSLNLATSYTQQIETLSDNLKKLTKEKDELHKLSATLSSDIKNLKVRLEEYRIETHGLKQDLKIATNHKNELQVALSERNIETQHLQKRLEEERLQLDKLNQRFQKEFENLAQKILEEKSEKFAHQNKENLSQILSPLQEKISFFEKRVEDTHKESIAHGARLQQQIIGLKELNEQMSTEANNLTRALKGESKTQGNWGEMILESVLEKSGLHKDREYFVQSSFKNEDGKRIMPDVIVKLPGNKRIIIDAKVSLTAYEKYVNESEKHKSTPLLQAHVKSIQRHVHQLSEKNYHTIYATDSPDFVLLFIPIESAFALASQEHPKLYQEAFDKNIILVTPTTLLAVLRTIDSIWQNEKQKQNAIEIATQAGKLYDTFVNLLNELEKVGHQLETTHGTYHKAMKKLTGSRNLFKNIQRLKELGAKTSKQIDEKYIDNVDNK